MSRHAEIAGAGIGGLSLGRMLAMSGWTVRVHERDAEIREAGTGIFLKNNAIDVLEEMGLFRQLEADAFRLERSLTVDNTGTLMGDRVLSGTSRLFAIPRQTLIQTLYDGAREAGVQVVLGSAAESVDPSGALILRGGERLEADLVVAADGVNSAVSDVHGIRRSVRKLPTIINRYMFETRTISPTPDMVEHWSGRYRVATAPCGANLTYAFQVYPQGDNAAASRHGDVTSWKAAFPTLHDLFDLMAQHQPVQSNYMMVKASSWHQGKLAIVGDAAHGLPPTLGQGAGLTLMNARALVSVLSERTSVEEALGRWEEAVRGIADTTQQWARRYDTVTRSWPSSLGFLRPGALWAMRTVRPVRERMLIADLGLRATRLEIHPIQQG